MDDLSSKSKTHKQRPQANLDLSGATALGFFEKTFQFLTNDADNALKRPWHKLERGLRIGRIREFVARETQRVPLNTEDSDTLFRLLLNGLDRKMLSSKAAVTYDCSTEQITEIKGLTAHTGANMRTKYQLVEKKAGTTLKRRNPPSSLPKELGAPKETPTTTSKTLTDGSGSKNEVT
jgi:hypothetical protein